LRWSRDEVGPCGPRRESARAFLTRGESGVVAEKIDGPFERLLVDDDFDEITVHQFSDGASGGCLWRDVTDTWSRGHSAESRIGDHRHVFAKWQVTERAGDLIRLFHSSAHRTTTDQHKNVPRLNLLRFDGGHRGGFRHEHFGPANSAVHTVFANNRGIDGGALHHGTFRCQVAHRKTHRRGEPARPRAIWRHDDVVSVHAVVVTKSGT